MVRTLYVLAIDESGIPHQQLFFVNWFGASCLEKIVICRKCSDRMCESFKISKISLLEL